MPASTTSRLVPTTDCKSPIFWDSVCDLKKPLHYIGTDSQSVCGIWPLPKPPTGGGGTAVVFADVASLKAYDPTPLGASALVYLRGYYAADDGGEGWFVFDKASTATDDGGSVLTGAGTGAYLRQLGDAVPRPEFFGAKGDGAIAPHTPGAWDGSVTGTDDEPALTKCLEVYGRAVLKGDTVYAVGRTVGANLPADDGPVSMVVEGEVRDTSIVAFLDGNLLPDGNDQVPVFRGGKLTRRVELRNLSVYCNQYNVRNDGGTNYGTQRRSVEALESSAEVTKVDTVKCYGYGRGTNRVVPGNTGTHQEPFVFSAFPVGTPTTDEVCVFQRIELAGPAKEYDAGDAAGDELPKSPFPEVTLLMADGRNSVLMADNWIHDHIRSSANHPHYHLMTTKDCVGVHVTRNSVERCDADLYYQDNGNVDGLCIDHNSVRNGLGALVVAGNNNGAGKLKNIHIGSNMVELAKQTGSMHPGSYGCIFTARLDNNTVPNPADPKNPTPVGDVFEGMTIADNQIYLPPSGTVAWDPRGILFQAWRFDTPPDPQPPTWTEGPGNFDLPAFRKVAVHDNVFEVVGFPLTTGSNPETASADSIIPLLEHPWSIVGTPQQLFAEGHANADPANVNIVTWRNVTKDGKRITPWSFAHSHTPGTKQYPVPKNLDPSNSFVGYDVDQRETDYKGVRFGRMWAQGGDMTTDNVDTLPHAFYLFGHGVAHATKPGPDRRSMDYYFHMTNESDWTVLMPMVPAAGYEDVGNANLCPADVALRMTFSVPGQTIRIAGKVDSSGANPYTVIDTFTVPPNRPLSVIARPDRSGGTGTQHWKLIADANVAHGVANDGKIPVWSGGVLVPSKLSDTGATGGTNSAGNLWPSPTLTHTLGGPTNQWANLYSRDINVGRDCHIGNAVNAQEVRLDGLRSAPSLATDASGKIILGTGGGGGARNFVDLGDTPLSIQDNKMLVGVTDALGAKKLQFATVPTGTVTLVKLTVPNTGTSTSIMTETPSGLANPLLIQVLMRVNAAGTVMTALAVKDGDVFDASTVMLAEGGLDQGAWGNAFQFGVRGINVIFVRPTPPVASGSTAGIAFPPFNKKFTAGDAFPVVPHSEVATTCDFIAVLKDVALPA